MRGLRPINIHIEKIEIHIVRPEPVKAPETAPEAFTAVCPDCGWTKSYPAASARNKGLAAHFHHCPGPVDANTAIRARVAEDFNRFLSGKLPAFDDYGNSCDSDSDPVEAYIEVKGTTRRRKD